MPKINVKYSNIEEPNDEFVMSKMGLSRNDMLFSEKASA